MINLLIDSLVFELVRSLRIDQQGHLLKVFLALPPLLVNEPFIDQLSEVLLEGPLLSSLGSVALRPLHAAILAAQFIPQPLNQILLVRLHLSVLGALEAAMQLPYVVSDPRLRAHAQLAVVAIVLHRQQFHRLRRFEHTVALPVRVDHFCRAELQVDSLVVLGRCPHISDLDCATVELVGRWEAERVVGVSATGDVARITQPTEIRADLDVLGPLQVQLVLTSAMVKLLAPLQVDGLRSEGQLFILFSTLAEESVQPAVWVRFLGEVGAECLFKPKHLQFLIVQVFLDEVENEIVVVEAGR